GILIAEKWVDKVIDVQKISERLMMIRMAIGKRVLNLISAYAPHPGNAAKEKEEFWKSVFELLMEISTEESVFVCGDLNGHVGSDPGGYRGVHTWWEWIWNQKRRREDDIGICCGHGSGD